MPVTLNVVYEEGKIRNPNALRRGAPELCRFRVA
jgi:hypothetical protein